MTRVASQLGPMHPLSGRRNEAFPARELCTKHGKHHSNANTKPMAIEEIGSDEEEEGNAGNG